MKNCVVKWVILGGLLAGNQALAQNAEDDFNVVLEEEPTRGNHGGVGSFGYDLSRKASFVNLNGFITSEFHMPQNGTPIFDQHYFNLIVSSEITDRISAEAQLEYEHGGEELEFRYGFVDYKVSDALVFRFGKFLTPAGEFNEYLYPDFLNKTVNRAWVNRNISPTAWGEVGVQVRGRAALGESGKMAAYYSAYVVNGLHGASGADIRNLRGNDRDQNSDKAFGGNLGLEIGETLSVSVNGYTGLYDNADSLRLSIYGLSATYNAGALSVWGELQAATQDYFVTVPGDAVDQLNKIGAYALVAYKLPMGIEPVVRYDFINRDGALTNDLTRITVGLNYYFTDNAVLKVNYELRDDASDANADDHFGVQFAIGF